LCHTTKQDSKSPLLACNIFNVPQMAKPPPGLPVDRFPILLDNPHDLVVRPWFARVDLRSAPILERFGYSIPVKRNVSLAMNCKYRLDEVPHPT
jgi:hypothetical protein